ncbi:MAG: adenosylcobinamide-GDP ribazoletransferase [Fusobacteriaceae bacterium]
MKAFFKSILLAFSFFTAIPIFHAEYIKKNMILIPISFPVVGLIVGNFGFLIFWLLNKSELTIIFKAIIFLIFFILISGGIHLDGLMDTADGFFSRRPDMQKRIEIMKDSRVGAFGVMTFIVLVLFRLGIFSELFSMKIFSTQIIFIPIISRISASLMLLQFDRANCPVLDEMHLKDFPKFETYLLGIILIIISVIDVKNILLIAVTAACYFYYNFWAKRNFGGITGDMLGAYIEFQETILFLVLLVFLKMKG